ncbi:hypothetical protein HispidOSU_003765, partial [Sigmodon hispidus]
GPTSPLLSAAFSRVQRPSAQAEQPSRNSQLRVLGQHMLKERVVAEQIKIKTRDLFLSGMHHR